MLTVAIPKRNKLQNIIVLTPKDGYLRKFVSRPIISFCPGKGKENGQAERGKPMNKK